MHTKNSDLIMVSYNGVIQDRSNRLLESSIISKKDMIKDKKIKGILVSLKGVVYEGDSVILKMLVKRLNILSQNMGISISLIDYSMELYRLFKKEIKNTKIRLFKNINVANLFLDPKAFKEGMCVLVYDDDEQNSKNLSSELSKYGYTVIRAKDSKEFQERMHEEAHDIIITQSALNEKLNSSKSSKNALRLSKMLISNLPVFMDTAVETLVSFTGLKAEKSAHSIKGFDTSLDVDNICAVMHFKGDLEGFFTLVFPEDIAIIALESLLGETVLLSDVETLKDGVGEFCNIITGSTKTSFANKGIKIIFDLPKTYNSLKATQSYIGENNGVWIDMQLAGKPFYMFITK
ncbi:chemotaxis protein CheX [Sulfurimonas sp.]|uniref:chemotaxis protein CheX n=1 Tax=Sulfurimonas sp. TaxID=2022749 RepID=UPI003561B8EF